MSKSPFEVPSEMRDLASRSVEQARKAFETFIGAAQKASDSVDTGAHPIQKNVADASRLTVSFAEKNMNAAFDMAQQLVQAKTMEEVVKIQTEFVQGQAQALQGQMVEAGTKAKQQFADVSATMQAGVKSAVDKATKKPAK